jgi:hypothetical protein
VRRSFVSGVGWLTCAQLQHKVERDEDAFEFHAPADDVYAVSSLLKVCRLC